MPSELRSSSVSQDHASSNDAREILSDIEADTSRALREDSGVLRSKSQGGSDSLVNQHFSVSFLNKGIKKKNVWNNLIPGVSGSQSEEDKSFQLAVLGTESRSRVSGLFQVVCPWFDEARRRREEFKTEMRVLSRLRHPCITTGMHYLFIKTTGLLLHESASAGFLYCPEHFLFASFQ